MKRFHFLDNPNSEIFRHATEIKIHLEKSPAGLGIAFHIIGGFDPISEDDQSDATASVNTDTDIAELAGKLLAEFLKGGQR